jgi:hypothetical protein
MDGTLTDTLTPDGEREIVVGLPAAHGPKRR